MESKGFDLDLKPDLQHVEWPDGKSRHCTSYCTSKGVYPRRPLLDTLDWVRLDHAQPNPSELPSPTPVFGSECPKLAGQNPSMAQHAARDPQANYMAVLSIGRSYSLTHGWRKPQGERRSSAPRTGTSCCEKSTTSSESRIPPLQARCAKSCSEHQQMHRRLQSWQSTSMVSSTAVLATAKPWNLQGR